MNFLGLSKTPNFENARGPCHQRTRPNAQRHAVVALGALLFALSAQDLSAQVGDNNSTGVSGIFNGQVNTGCSYDPYTGNATRSITDIAVAGAVGEYPLALVRTANSRAPSTTEVFGWAGGWNHNYNWILEDSERSQTQNFHPASYTVEFPDGRVETFKQVNWDTSCYRVRASNGGAASSAGVRERFVQLDLNQNNQTYLYAYLVLPDGGKVEFRAQQHSANGRYYYKYHATGIYDPHGLKTTFQSEVTPNGLRRQLVWVIEPSGQRFLHFTYVGPNNAKIASIEASDGRVVNYNYIYCNGCRLDNVVYYNNANWTARYQYTGSNIGLDLPPLLWTADDPMYAGPMKRIAYEYKPGGPTDPNNPDGTRPVYGQILRERYWDGVSQPGTGAIVSELTVGESPNITYTRRETRGDGKTRSFIYSGEGQINWASDFMGYYTQQHYDATTKYIDYVVDRNGHRTDYALNWLTGNMAVTTFPLTTIDTPGQQQRPMIQYSYGWSGCADQNNRDGNNPYFICTTADEAGHVTQFWRDTSKRVTRIDYPDGGYETFTYDAAHFYRLSSHLMKTGGTETFAYDGLHRLQYYSDPYHSNPVNPSMQYFYDAWDRVVGVVDALSHSTNWDYNDRGQITVTTLPWINSVRYTIRNLYNPDGTLQSRTDQLGHVTSYEYDDYRRLKSVTLPARGDGTGTHTTSFYYGANAWNAVDDYKWADSNVTWVVLHSGKKTKTLYDDNRRKSNVTVGWGTTNPATTSYGYDNVGNVTTVTNPRNSVITTVYDERNRPSEVHDPYANVTSFTYDTVGRAKTITRPNGQVITNASFDAMNRVLQQNVTQTPDPLAVTKYTYYPSGLLNTMTDPHNSTDSYIYTYDLMGRKSWVTYPADSIQIHRTEHYTYDAVGRLDTFKNRKGDVQTFHYDALDRLTYFTWDDGLTPRVDFSYDAASRLTEIDNANATITRTYWDDNLLRAETEQITGGSSKTVSYFYNADANRDSITYPDYQNFAYTYTGRNQLKTVGPWATYTYDENGYIGDLTTRTVNNGTQSTYLYDPLDRVTWITHALTSGGRGFNYGYDDVSVGNRKYVRRTGTTLGNKGDVFSYDLADQVSGVQLNVTSPQSTPAPPRSIFYDANGNRTTFRPYGPTDTYVTNNLNQYTSRNSNNATYDNGNMIVTPDPAGSRSTYAYDAQNRLTQAMKNGVTMTFAYDGLNRQVKRIVAGGANPGRFFSVWDGWDLIEEYQSSGTVTAKYVYGPSGLAKELVNNRYYYQDGSGSTSHVANASGQLLEWYRYDLQGAPFFYNASDTQLSASAQGVRHLFTGQQWHQDLGLYDLRNRFYSPDLGRFLQPDPIGFRGGKNLYRYCRNNPVTRWDPFGLQYPTANDGNGAGGTATAEPVVVTGSFSPPIDRGGTGAPSGGGGGGGGGELGIGPHGSFPFELRYGLPPRNSNSNTQQQPSQQNSQAAGIDFSYPMTTAEFIIVGNMIEHGDTTDTTPAIDPIDLLSGGIAALVRSSFRSVVKVISTPYGRAIQSTSAEARAALRQVEGGATVYKGGVLGRSETSVSQFFSLENPLNPGYARRYGIPPQNSNFDFILSGRVQPGAPVITRPAPGIPPNLGEGIEAVTNPGSFRIDSFYMPD